MAEIRRAKVGHATHDAHVAALLKEFADPANLEKRARDVVGRMATALQAAPLVQHAPAADAWCASRLAGHGCHNYGILPRDNDVGALLARPWPV